MLIALVVLASVGMAHSRDSEEIGIILNNLVPIVIPAMIFLFGTVIAIVVTRSIVNANARTKIARYDMLKKFAETGTPLPKEFRDEIQNEFNRGVKENSWIENTVEVKIDSKDRNFLKFIGIAAAVCGAIMLMNVRNFSGDLPEFIISLILISAAVCCFWFYFKIGMMTQNSYQKPQNKSQNCNPNNTQNGDNWQDNQNGNSQQ